MQHPSYFWNETADARTLRVTRQEYDRSSCTDDHMELAYTEDLDELFAEMLRLHKATKETRTIELIRRIFPERLLESRVDLSRLADE